jgi:hypothetical protein
MPVTDGTNGTPRTAAETRPKNVAVLYCQYSGGNGVALPTGANQLIQNVSSVTVTDTGSNGTIALATAGAERLRVTTGGNVGIGSTSPGAALDVNGGIKSTKWAVTGVLANTPGPLPLSGSFSSGGGTLLVTACGAGWWGTSGVNMGFNVQIDGVTKGATSLYNNNASTHLALPCANFVVTGISSGSHTAGIVANSLNTGGVDYFSLTVLELPF